MDQGKLQELIDAAVNERRAGNRAAAIGLFKEVIEGGRDHPLALNALGLDAMAHGRLTEAATFLERAIAADPGAPDLWMNLARVRRAQNDDHGEERALIGALSIDQRHFMATVRMAELLERRGEPVQAAERWRGVLTMASLVEERTPALEMMVERARDFVAQQHERYADRIEKELSAVRHATPPAERRRFDVCIDHALGRREIYANRCSGMHFPFLPADEFFDREHFPWLTSIEAQTDGIRAELEANLADRRAAILPYIAMPPGTPANKWSPLDHSLEWGAMHLWKDGQRDDAVYARFPRTAAAVEALPLSDLPGRTPTVFFSLLKPGAHLPAHTGVSNVRAIVHLPLIVPAGCTFRVGGETRTWSAGEAWAFDDTIEHEAWNRSDQMRAILIFDVWNPHITSKERALLRCFYAASAEVDGALDRAIDLSE